MKFNLNIIGRRKYWYILSLLIIIPGLISLLIQGLNLGIDFTGGNLMQIQFKQDVNSAQVREVFAKYTEQSFSVQETGKDNFLVRTSQLSEEDNKAILADLTSKIGENEILRNELVGPVIGRELTMNAVYALIIASILMVIYITFRFEIKFGIAAIIALLHDIMVLVGIFSLFQIEVDSTFVAVILTIIGYSINDTIVIFDRIRENLRITKKIDSFGHLVNDSIMQTLTRSINTGMSVIFMLIALMVLGGQSTQIFSFALLVGIISGTYSSIFVASPLWVDFSIMAKKKVAKARA